MFYEKFKDLLAINKPCIWIRTSEEKEVLAAILNILTEEFEQIRLWSTLNISDVSIQNNEIICTNNKIASLNGLVLELQKLLNETTKFKETVYVFRDYHVHLNKPEYVRMIKDITEIKTPYYVPFIFISSNVDIPIELEGIISIIDYDSPTQEEIFCLLEKYEHNKMIELENKEQLSNYFVGFNRKEIIDLLNLSFIKYDTINLSYIANKKIDKIKETNILDYKIPTVSLDEIGGNNNFKSWLNETRMCMTEEARLFNIPKPKGHLALGLPGTSKSYTAEALAASWNVPFIKLNISKITSKYVGETEKNMLKGIQLIESCAPCILLIDEVEKVLGGYKSSNTSDSGAISRVFATILDFMCNNDKGVYTIMTSNDITQLPPELTRAGRLDATWYFSLPDEEERKEIFSIHLKKIKQEIDIQLLNNIAKETKGYTGAEIEQIVKSATRKAFVRYKKEDLDTCKITKNDLQLAKEDVIPISQSSKETVRNLEDWARGRALFANNVNKKNSALIKDVENIKVFR